MPRQQRYIPQGDGPVVVEVMTRCFQSRFFLACTTKPEARRLFWGVWGHALRKFPDVQLSCLITQANHYHATLVLLRADPQLLADFMALVNSNLARELNRLLSRTGTFWQARYSAFPVSESEQETRLKYLLGNGIASGDYRSPVENPMPNTANLMAFGHPEIKGTWINRADHSRAKFAGKSVTLADFTETLEVPLHPLPVHAHLTDAERQARIRELMKEAAAEADAKREARGIKPRKLCKLLKLDPLTRPSATKRSTMPFAKADPATEKAWRTEFRLMQEQRWAALKSLARHFGDDVHWPPSAPKPSALLAAEADLAVRAAPS